MQLTKPKRKPKSKREPNPQKHQRLVDPSAIEEVRNEHSEISGEQAHGAPPHHIYSVGAGGPDHRFNLIQTTGIEHIDIHAGLYSQGLLLEIVAARENETVEFIKAEINRMRGRQ